MKKYLNKAKTLVKPLYLLYLNICHILKWHSQFVRSKQEGLVPEHLNALEITKDDRVVILAPHADDEWIGSYSVLNLQCASISCVYFNLYGEDASESNVKTRNAEIKASSDYWGFHLIHNHNYDINSLLEVLGNATVCFIPSPYDWHIEHRKVFQTFVKSYERLTNDEKRNLSVYYYCVSVPHSVKECQYYLPLTRKDLYEKWTQFKKIYVSQSFMPARRYQYQLRLVPSALGYAAQTFLKADQKRIEYDLEKTQDSLFVKSIRKAQLFINNIYKIRVYLDSVIYEKDWFKEC